MMDIPGRKKKTESMRRVAELNSSPERLIECAHTSSKAVREMTLFLLLAMNEGFRTPKATAFFGVCEKTIYRYIQDLQLSGIAKEIIHEEKAYWLNGDHDNKYETEAPRSTQPHIVRMNRIFRAFGAFVHPYIDAIFGVEDENYDYEDDQVPVSGEMTVSIGPTDMLIWINENLPEQSVDLRTVQRDYAVIAEAMEYFRALWA